MLYALKRGNNKIITKHMKGVIRMALTEVLCKLIVKSILGEPNIMSMIPFKSLHVKWQCGAGSFFTGRTFKLAHFEDCPLATFAENKRFSCFFFFFFYKGTNKIQVFNYATIEHYKTLGTHLTSQETALKFMNVIGSFAKKLENLL